MKYSIVFIFFVFYLNLARGLKILGVFPVPGPSHNILATSLMKGLAERGHEIVYVTPFRNKIPKELNFTEVLLPEVGDAWRNNTENLLEKIHVPFWEQTLYTAVVVENVTRGTLNHPNFQKMLKTHKHFDAVIVHQHHMDSLKVLAWHYKAPLILFHSLGPNGWVNYYTGSPFPTSYAPDVFSGLGTEMTFLQRAYNSAIFLFLQYYNEFVLVPIQKRIYYEYFPNAPPYDEVAYNASLVLLMSDISTYPALPTVPNVKDIGGFHVKPAKSLPADLQKIMDAESKGIIYFSMGSNLKSADMKPEVRNLLLRVFSKLDYKVFWKWEEDNLPGQPKNVEIRKWYPQQEMLGHPNLKLFISHGGLLSTTEAVYHGVQMLAVPVFFDQYLNSKIITNNGFGLTLAYENLNEEELEEKLHELLNNSTYSKKAKAVSKIFHDKAMKPMDKAVYWVEYVIRHQGAPHLRIAGLKLPWYKYWLLDIIFSLILLAVVLVYVVLLSIRKCLRSTNKIKQN